MSPELDVTENGYTPTALLKVMSVPAGVSEDLTLSNVTLQVSPGDKPDSLNVTVGSGETSRVVFDELWLLEPLTTVDVIDEETWLLEELGTETVKLEEEMKL